MKLDLDAVMKCAGQNGGALRVKGGTRVKGMDLFPGTRHLLEKMEVGKQTGAREGLHIHRLLDLAIFQCSKFKTAGSSALFLGEVPKVLFEIMSYLGKAVLSCQYALS